MKFLRLEVDNWRPFRGKSEMALAASDTQPITLVFGKNGGGKTSLLAAIYWCLYGRMDLEQGKSDQHLVNDYAVQEAEATLGDPMTATVTLYAAHTSHGTMSLYRIERTRRAYMANGAHTEDVGGLTVDRIPPPQGFRLGDDVVAAYRQAGAGSERYDAADHAQRVINKLLSPKLAKYFFYPGEMLAFPFKDDEKSQNNLRTFLEEIAGKSKFEPYKKTLDAAFKRLAEKSKAHAAANEVTQRLQAEIEDHERDKAQKQLQRPQTRAERDAAAENRRSVVAQIDALDEFRVQLSDAEAARQSEQTAEAGVAQAEQALSDALRDAYLCVASPIFRAVLEVYKKRKYPNDVSRALVEQMSESMRCICERDLDDEMLERLAPRSPTDDSVANRMAALASHASGGQGSNTASSAVDAARDGLDKALRSRNDAVRGRAAAEGRLTQAGAGRLDGVSKDNLIAVRSQHDETIRKLDTRIGGLDADIKQIDKTIADKDAAKRKAAPQVDQVVHLAAGTARQMQGMLSAISQKQADVAREHLEDLIARNYKIYKSTIRAGIDSEFRVKVHDSGSGREFEKPVGDLSGSETALLTYAFAAAAAKLIPQYQTVHKLLTTVPQFDEVENIPLVVDAPFASLGPEYKRRVMDLMTNSFSQVVMFTESADTDVLEEAADKIGAEHLVRFEGDMTADVETTFEWRGRTFVYASPNSATTKSTLERIEATT